MCEESKTSKALLVLDPGPVFFLVNTEMLAFHNTVKPYFKPLLTAKTVSERSIRAHTANKTFSQHFIRTLLGNNWRFVHARPSYFYFVIRPTALPATLRVNLAGGC